MIYNETFQAGWKSSVHLSDYKWIRGFVNKPGMMPMCRSVSAQSRRTPQKLSFKNNGVYYICHTMGNVAVAVAEVLTIAGAAAGAVASIFQLAGAMAEEV